MKRNNFQKSLVIIFSSTVIITCFILIGKVAGTENRFVNQPDDYLTAESLEPIEITSSRNDLSSPLKELTIKRLPLENLSEDGTGQIIPTFPLPKVSNIGKELTMSSPQTFQPAMPGVESMPPLIHSFDGIANRNSVQPPDTEGDIGYDPDTGINYYMQWVNLSLAVWDVTDPQNVNLLLGPVNGNSIFFGFGGPCERSNNGDPIVLFDHLSNRWLASQFALPNRPEPPYYQCVAVSQTADPTGQWYRYEYRWPGDKLNDYPKFGVWPDGYYLSVNQFAPTGTGDLTWAGAGVAAFERDEMLAGNPARMVYMDLFSVNPEFGGLLPAELDGPPPVEGTPNYFVSWDDSSWIGDQSDAIRIWEFIPDWRNPNNSTFGLNGLPNEIVSTSDLDPDMCDYARQCIPQPDTTNKLDAISDRLMYRLQYRNFGSYEGLFSNHTVDINNDDHAGVHWFELRSSTGNWSLHQEGLYGPDSENRWMGSIAADRLGNVALGYSVASTTTYPSIRYTGRYFSDPLGTLPLAEATLVAGTGSQTGFSNRWGDYSMMGVDPTDDCTFWYTQQYYKNSGSNWLTRIGSFKYPTCPPIPSGYDVTLSPDGASTGLPGNTIYYTVTITNTGSFSDSYSIFQTGANWPTQIKPTLADLEAGASTGLTITVAIPSAAVEGAKDALLVTASSLNDPYARDYVILNTTAILTPTSEYRRLFPIFFFE